VLIKQLKGAMIRAGGRAAGPRGPVWWRLPQQMHLGGDQEFDMNQAAAKIFRGKPDVLLPSPWETFQFSIKSAALVPAMFKLTGRIVKKEVP
jgi:hypothetical protein